MKTALVVCGGMMRSGSTWSFNVCRLLGQFDAKRSASLFWSGYLTLEQAEQFFQQTNGNFPGPTIVKAHGIGPLGQQLIRDGRATAVCTYRDPRDCVASLMSFSDETFERALSRIRDGLHMLDDYPRDGQTLFIRYEQMLADPLAHIRKIAAHLCIDADESQLRGIDELTGVDASKRSCRDLKQRPNEKTVELSGHRVDPKTWLHDNHIQHPEPGRSRTELTPEQARVLNHDLGRWLNIWGYGKSDVPDPLLPAEP